MINKELTKQDKLKACDMIFEDDDDFINSFLKEYEKNENIKQKGDSDV